VELSVALISRPIPQVNVFFLGLPLKILIGIALVAVALPAILSGMAGIFRFLLDGVSAAVAAGGAGLAGASPFPSVTP
jgi:flagellar biosynthesis protein FliR